MLDIDIRSWPPIRCLRDRHWPGSIELRASTFNMGLGMVLAAPGGRSDQRAIRRPAGNLIGRVVPEGRSLR